MTRDNFLGWLRTAMTIAGSLLIGNVILGYSITNEIVDGIIGGGLFVASVILGVRDKTASEEMINSALFKVISFAGGIAVTAGYLKASVLIAILGAVPLIGAEIVKRIANKKDQRIVKGTLGVADLKAAVNVEKKGEDVRPVINTPA
jgi:hypothetical protein